MFGEEDDMGQDAIGNLQAEIDALKAKASASVGPTTSTTPALQTPKLDFTHAIPTKGIPMAAPTIKVNLRSPPQPKAQPQPDTQENVTGPVATKTSAKKNLNYALPGGVAGGVVGFAVGGPIGAALGAGVGAGGGYLAGRWQVYMGKKK